MRACTKGGFAVVVGAAMAVLLRVGLVSSNSANTFIPATRGRKSVIFFFFGIDMCLGLGLKDPSWHFVYMLLSIPLMHCVPPRTPRMVVWGSSCIMVHCRELEWSRAQVSCAKVLKVEQFVTGVVRAEV